MKARQLPVRTKNGLPAARLRKDPQVIKWSKRLLGDPEALPDDLSEDQLIYVMQQVAKRRGAEFDLSLYEKAMDETAQRFVAPDITDVPSDLDLLLQQPELVGFWREWLGPIGRGEGPNYAAAKAVMATIAFGSIGPYLQTAHGVLGGSPKLEQVFNAAEQRALSKQLTLAPYSTVSRVAGKLGSCHELAMRSNIELLKTLKAENPNAGIGRFLAIDGKAVPAWVPQRSSRGHDAIERQLRKRTPAAGFRAYQHTSTSKKNLKSGDVVTISAITNTKFWRGYYLVAIVDLATGLPVVWHLQDASINEEFATIPLLSDLYRLWPDIGTEYLVADSAWDEEQMCRLCEVEYGIHPVFRIHNIALRGKLLPAGKVKGKAAGFDNHGRIVCGPHRKELKFNTFEAPSRAGLRPGQTSKENEFRVRGECTHHQNPCGRISVQCQNEWRSLTFLPHYPQGNPKGYALRQALLTRLNTVESVFNRLEAGRLLGSDGGDRTRVCSTETHESLISLALLGMTALTVTEQRLRTAAPAANAPAGGWASPLAA